MVWADSRRGQRPRRHSAALALLAAVLGLPGPSWAGPLPAPIAGEMRENKLPEADASLYVLKVGESAPRLALNPTTPRLPASVIKLLTTAAALDTLGPTFTFNTEAYATGTLTKGCL